MKLLFFSSDLSEVEQAGRACIEAGIACEIRSGPVAQGVKANPHSAELWIQNEKDAHRALLLCVDLGLGFSKRAARRPQFAPEMETGKLRGIVFTKEVSEDYVGGYNLLMVSVISSFSSGNRPGAFAIARYSRALLV